MPETTPQKTKFLVMGLDGASFNLIQPWLDAGLLPNFRRLIEGGASGELDSCIPPVTMPAWRVYSTGKYPGKLGVFWHQQLDPETLEVQTPNATFFKSRNVWDYLNSAGIRTGILGMPDTYPPQRLEGFLVAGPPNSASDGYTYPAELQSVVEGIGYQPFLKADFQDARHDSAIVHDTLELINKTFETAEVLLDREKVDFLQVVSFDINKLQHFFFDEEPSLNAWQIADRWLGRMRERFDYVLVHSDHGTERVKRAFFLNVWLRQNGYLKTRFHPADLLLRLGLNRSSLGRLAMRVGITRLFKMETLLKLGSLLPTSAGGFGEFGNKAAARRVDWPRTRAFALPQGPVYINRRVVPNDRNYEVLRDELIAAMSKIEDPDTGLPIFKRIYRREDVYQGPFVNRAPHLLAMSVDAYHNRAGLTQANVFATSWDWKGNNRQKGLFILSGPGVRPSRLSDARIVDLMPTILRLYNVSAPGDLDGRALVDALEGDLVTALPSAEANLGTNHLVEVDDEFDDTVRKRLESLGYL
jgi:predicted AlkP superfamily phosphohydrolase/phosphomutase